MDYKDVADTVKSGASYLKDKVMGTKEQNEKASAEMKAQDEKSPETTQAKVNKVLGYKKGGSMEHKHKIEHDKKHSAGFQHEQEKVAKHSAGHKMHHDHIKEMMRKGGKC